MLLNQSTMHREDDSNYLLFIEPPRDKKSSNPQSDDWTKLLEKALKDATIGTSSYLNRKDNGTFYPKTSYKGFHTTVCGRISSNQDYLLKNGMITNSLAVFYLEYYRNAIPDSEWEKLQRLKEYYKKR